jgi:hypothetical protein
VNSVDRHVLNIIRDGHVLNMIYFRIGEKREVRGRYKKGVRVFTDKETKMKDDEASHTSFAALSISPSMSLTTDRRFRITSLELYLSD